MQRQEIDSRTTITHHSKPGITSQELQLVTQAMSHQILQNMHTSQKKLSCSVKFIISVHVFDSLDRSNKATEDISTNEVLFSSDVILKRQTFYFSIL